MGIRPTGPWEPTTHEGMKIVTKEVMEVELYTDKQTSLLYVGKSYRNN